MDQNDWNEQSKRLLKSELVRRGISNDDLVGLLADINVDETKASIDSKISRGTFSASFLLNAIGCKSIVSEIQVLEIVEEPRSIYKKKSKKIKDDIRKRKN